MMRVYFLTAALWAVSGFSNAFAAPAVSEPIMVARQIQVSAAPLSRNPLDSTSVDFLRYAVQLRRAYGLGEPPSNELRDLRARLANKPAEIFNFMERWEREANDCDGVATMALYASFADLTPSYLPLHRLIDGKLKTLVAARLNQDAFRGFKCKAGPNSIGEYDAEVLAEALLGIRYVLEARGGAQFSMPREAVEAKITDSETRSAMVKLGGVIRRGSVK
jgi:hypothetical protein